MGYSGEIARPPSDWKPTDAEIQAKDAEIRAAVSKVLGGLPKGFQINRDPRGYALKLDRDSYPDVKIHEDMGGFGILAPEIDGE